MREIDRLFWKGIAVFAILLVPVCYLLYWAHKDDARLRAECEAKGGTLIEARSPAHVCVKPM